MAWVLEHSAGVHIEAAQRLSDTYMVYIDHWYVVYTWDGAADVEIGDFGAIWGVKTFESLTVFNGVPYIKFTDGGSASQDIYAYSGVPGSWTLVYTGPGNINPSVIFPAADGASYLFNDDCTNPSIFDGSSWQSVPLVPGSTSMRGKGFSCTDGNVYDWFCDLDVTRYIKFDGVQFSQIGSLPAGYEYMIQQGSGFTAIYAYETATGRVWFSADEAGTWGYTGVTLTTFSSFWTLLWSTRIGSVLHELLVDWDGADDNINYRDPIAGTWSTVSSLAGGADRYFIWKSRLYAVLGTSILYDDTFVPFAVGKDSEPGGNYALVFDVSADDTYLYIAVLKSGSPVLYRMNATALAAPVSVYAPGAGDFINVRCGRLHADWVWIAGNFGTPKLRCSINAGGNWTTKDPGWANAVGPFMVGPNSDDLVAALLADSSVQETLNGGLTWTQKSADIGIVANAADRLDVHTDEAIVGADVTEPGVVRVQFTPNNYGNMSNVTGTVPVDAYVTDVIVG